MGWFWFWLPLCIAATVYDWWTTMEAFKRGAKEGNPAARWLFEKLGNKGKLVFDLVVVTGIAFLCLTFLGWEAAVIWLSLLSVIQLAVGVQNGSKGRG